MTGIKFVKTAGATAAVALLGLAGISITSTRVHADSDEASSELVHDDEHPVTPDHDGLTTKEIRA